MQVHCMQLWDQFIQKGILFRGGVTVTCFLCRRSANFDRSIALSAVLAQFPVSDLMDVVLCDG